MSGITEFNSAIGWIKNYTKIIYHNRGVENLITLTPAQEYHPTGSFLRSPIWGRLNNRQVIIATGNLIQEQNQIGGNSEKYRCLYLSNKLQICNALTNKKGSTANATSLKNNFINHCVNDNGDNNAKLFNNLVQQLLIVNYSPDCLALRCLRLISSRIAVTINCASLSFSCFRVSIASNTSSGTLAVFWRDLLFNVPVAIVYSLSFKWESLYLFLTNKKHLKCKSLNSKVQVTLVCLVFKTTKPYQCSNTNRASNHNVIRGNTMAMYKSTQTHPKFLWRFFSCQQSKYFSVEANNEQEARSMLPDSPCLFSARIRQGVNRA